MRASLAAALLLVSCAGSEGPAGSVGPVGPAGPSAALHVGAGLFGDGSSAQPLSIAFGASGAAAACSRADHAHAADELLPGELPAGVTVPAASVAGAVAEALHAASAEDAASLGGVAASGYVTLAALAPYVTVAAADARYATAVDLAAYARVVDVPALSGGKIPAAYLPASVPLLDGTGQLSASVLPPHVAAANALVGLSSPPATPVSGSVYFDTALKQVRYWDGTGWLALRPRPAMLQFSPQSANLSVPAGQPGALTVTLQNVGDEVADGPVLWASPGFGAASGCGNQLAPGASCLVSVQVDPGASGTARTGIVVASGGSGAVLGISVAFP
jgi:hypothetical protein